METSIGLSFDPGQFTTGILNYKQQKKQLKYQKKLQKEMFRREDTAHQRAVADLRAAGLSPTLAAGAGASAGPVVQTQAPEIDLGSMAVKSDTSIDPVALLRMDKDFAKLDAEIDLLKTKRVEAEASTLDHKAGAFKKSVEAERTKYDTGIAKESGQETNPGPLLRTTRNIATTLNAAWRNQAKKIVSVDEVKKRGNERRDKLNKALMGTGYNPKNK